MDFFEYASVASIFANTLWVQLLIGGLCFLIVFIFQAIALFVIATREGYKNKWMAFVPIFNTYYIGVCAQKNRFYNIDTKKIGIAAAVLEVVLFILYVVYYVACYLVIDYEIEVTLTNSLGLTYKEYRLNDYVPDNLKWAAWMYNYMDSYILNIANLILVLLEVCLLICFFQTYACRRYVIFTITSILFPIQGILFFVVRNNKGVNYREYVLAEQAKQYRMYQQYQQNYGQQNPYNGNPYNQNPYNRNPYNRNGNQNSGGSAADPFDNLGNSNSGNNGSDPFDDFDK